MCFRMDDNFDWFVVVFSYVKFLMFGWVVVIFIVIGNGSVDFIFGEEWFVCFVEGVDDVLEFF